MPAFHPFSAPGANGVRAPICFSEAVTPRRVLVLDDSGRQLGFGTHIARHTLMGRLIGHLVALDDGTRMAVPPVQLREAHNVIVPPASLWQRGRAHDGTC